MEKEFYSVKEVAEMHGLKEATIRQFIKRGQLEAVKFSGVNMITQDALKAWESTRKPRKRDDNMGVRVTCIYIIDKCTQGLKCSEYCDQDFFYSGYITCDLYIGKDERIGATCLSYNPCEAMIHRTYKAVEYESDIGLTLGREIIPRENIKYLAMDYGDGEKIFIDERES